MFRNMYDTDVTVWSPEGRLLQVSLLLVSDVMSLYVHLLLSVQPCFIDLL